MKKVLDFGIIFISVFNNNRITRSAAALSYYFMMTFFPLVIILYTLLGNNYIKAMQMVQFLSHFLSNDTTGILRVFLTYVANNHSTAMMVAGITIFLTSASAAIRSITFTIADMQGGLRYPGIIGFLFSIVLACFFMAALYFGIVVLFTGRSFLESINRLLPFIDISGAWNSLRFIIFGLIEFLLFWVLFAVTRQQRKHYNVVPGAILSTVALVAVSILFSMFIGASVKYPLVYGSLASIILMMFWLYLSCITFYCGAVFNITLKRMKNPVECELEVQKFKSMLPIRKSFRFTGTDRNKKTENNS